MLGGREMTVLLPPLEANLNFDKNAFEKERQKFSWSCHHVFDGTVANTNKIGQGFANGNECLDVNLRFEIEKTTPQPANE